MLIQEWGEEGFISYLQNQFFSKEQSTIGIGDDCAVIPFKDQSSYLVTTDALIEGIHFLKYQISPLDLGYKSVAVSVSDIAAMGGEPKYAFLTIAIPKDIDQNWLKFLIQGIREACLKWNILLLGGDTVGSIKDIFINGTVIGIAHTQQIKYRSFAKPKDILCVTRSLGDSAAGLKILQDGLSHSGIYGELIRTHFRPEPNPNEGMWLAMHDGVHAMMDISDGLNCDLKRLLKASRCGGIVEITQLPISNSLKIVGIKEGWDTTTMALKGGEDYCLLFAITEGNFKEVQQSFYKAFGKNFYPIGWVTEGSDLEYQKHGNSIILPLKDFSHF